MTEDDRRRERDRAVDDRQVAVTKPGGLDPDDHLASVGVLDPQVIDQLVVGAVVHDSTHVLFSC